MTGESNRLMTYECSLFPINLLNADQMNQHGVFSYLCKIKTIQTKRWSEKCYVNDWTLQFVICISRTKHFASDVLFLLGFRLFFQQKQPRKIFTSNETQLSLGKTKRFGPRMCRNRTRGQSLCVLVCKSSARSRA